MLSGTVSTSAPYADIAIPLHFSSVTGLRHRTINCMECGSPMLERSNDIIYRLNDSSQPSEIALAGTVIPSLCGNCYQRYELLVSVGVTYVQTVPLHTQSQSIYIVPASVKHVRFLFCLECGKKFHGISDRIGSVSDNTPSPEHISAGHLGPMEAICSFKHCRQSWALMA